MKYQELIELINTDPSDENIAVAKQWLAKKRKSFLDVGLALLQKRSDKETLEWIGNLVKDSSWEIFYRAYFDVLPQDDKARSWILTFARKNSDNPNAGPFWWHLVANNTSGFINPDLIEGAGDWLYDHGEGVDAVSIAALLLCFRNRKVEEKALKLAEEFPESEYLITNLVEHMGDERSIQLGLKLLNQSELSTGLMVAAALLKTDRTRLWPIIEQWLRKHWDNPELESSLTYLLSTAPPTVAPLVFQWIDENNKFDNAFRIIEPGFVLSPRQEYLDLTWNWLSKTRSDNIPREFLSLFLDNRNQLSLPDGFAEYADRWISENLYHENSRNVLVGLLKLNASPTRIEVARNWLKNAPEVDRGSMLLELVRLTDEKEFSEQALIWAENHPNEQGPNQTISDTQKILIELLSRDPENPTIKSLLKSDNEELPDKLLFALVKEGDEDAKLEAKRRVSSQDLEGTGGDTAMNRKARILIHLLQNVPNDPEIFQLTETWLKEDGDKSGMSNSYVRAAYALAKRS